MKIAKAYGVQANNLLKLLSADDNRNVADDSSPDLSSEAMCTICKAAASKYTCPRCFRRYCAVECYQKHGSQCTESFYKEQVRFFE